MTDSWRADGADLCRRTLNAVRVTQSAVELPAVNVLGRWSASMTAAVLTVTARSTVQCPASVCCRKRRRREMLITAALLLLLRADHGHALPRARSSSGRDDETTSRADEVITDTQSGRIRGIRHRAPYLRRPVDAYLGIPFAKPPLNSLRFRHPQPIEKWRNIYNATRLPNSCYQLHDTVFGTDFYVNQSST